MSTQRRFLQYVLISAAAWCCFVPFYNLLFSWTEYIPGINWVYLPHGLRMILVLLFGIPGAVGFSLGAAVLRFTLLPEGDIGWALHVCVAVIPGLAAWSAVALILRNWPGRELRSMSASAMGAVRGRDLLLIAFVSATFNSAGHAAAWWMFAEGSLEPANRYSSMFVGDLLGAILLLYILKGLFRALDQPHSPSESNVSQEAKSRADRSLSAFSLVTRRPE